MEEAVERVLAIFYGMREHNDVRNLRVLHWSPKDGVISVRWQQGDSTITVKSIANGDDLIVNELK